MSFRNLHKHTQKQNQQTYGSYDVALGGLRYKILNMNIVNIKKFNHYNDCKKSGITSTC